MTNDPYCTQEYCENFRVKVKLLIMIHPLYINCHFSHRNEARIVLNSIIFVN